MTIKQTLLAEAIDPADFFNLDDRGTSADYFPGRDFPDREVWLARRNTPRNLFKQRGKLIHASRDQNGKGVTLVMGVNKLKRVERALFPKARRAPSSMLESLLAQRRRYQLREHMS